MLGLTLLDAEKFKIKVLGISFPVRTLFQCTDGHLLPVFLYGRKIEEERERERRERDRESEFTLWCLLL